MGDCTELLLYLLQWKQGAAKEDRDRNKRTPLLGCGIWGIACDRNSAGERGKVDSMDDM